MGGVKLYTEIYFVAVRSGSPRFSLNKAGYGHSWNRIISEHVKGAAHWIPSRNKIISTVQKRLFNEMYGKYRCNHWPVIQICPATVCSHSDWTKTVGCLLLYIKCGRVVASWRDVITASGRYANAEANKNLVFRSFIHGGRQHH